MSLSHSYDKKAAGDLVDDLVQARLNLQGASAVPLSELSVQTCTTVQEGTPRFLRIVETASYEEPSLRVVGVLVYKNFPLLRPPTVNERLRHRHQAVGIAGFGSTSFEQDVQRLMEVHTWMERSLPQGTFEELPLLGGPGCRELHFKCRYFTVGEDARTVENVEIPPLADYNDVISTTIQRNDVRYGELNRVAFYRAVQKPEGLRHEPISPIVFRHGDIVEVGFTIMGLPVQDGQVKCLLVQNSITLLEDKLTTAAALAEREKARMGAQDKTVAVENISRRIVKRKAGFNEEDDAVAEARKGVARMQVEQETAKLPY